MSRREQLEQMLAADPDDAFLLYALAMEDLAAGELSRARTGLDRVLASDPGHVAAHFQKGQLLAREGELDDAREILVRGIEAARRAGDSHAESEMTGFLDAL